MARRHAGKASPRTTPQVRDRGGRIQADTGAAESALRERLAALEQERDTLRVALDRERARVRKLEEMNASARDRLAWALDSLQNILETKR